MKINSETDFERVKTALSCGIPDRVPLMEVLVDHVFKEAFLGRRIGNVEQDLLFWKAAGYDYIILGRRIAGYPPFWDSARFDNYYEIQAKRAHTPGFRGPVKD